MGPFFIVLWVNVYQSALIRRKFPCPKIFLATHLSSLADIDFSYFSVFIFEVNHVFMEEKDNAGEKIVIDEKELDGI